MTKHFLPVLAGISVFLASCSHAPKGPFSDRFQTKAPSDLETVVILGMNDFHGALAPLHRTTREEPGVSPQAYDIAGAATFAGYVRILQAEFGDRLLVLDAGDEFQGTIESNAYQGATVVQYFNKLGVQGAAIGNHEFDYGPVGPVVPESDLQGALKERMKEAKYPYLAANIVGTSFPNTYPRKIYTVGKLKVGVFGLTTLQTPTTTRPEFVRNLNFTELKAAAVREAAALRSEGADIVVLTSHVGLECELGREDPKRTLWTSQDALGHCGEKDEMVTFLNSLPPHTVDGVVSGHSHTVIHHFIADTPVVQAGSRGMYLNLIYLTFDTKKKELVRGDSTIEGPIPVCPKFFANQRNCNGAEPAPKAGRGKLIAPSLHGVIVEPDSDVAKDITALEEKSKTVREEVFGEAIQAVDHVRERESPLGDLIADALRVKTGADLALVNPGGIRVNLEAGKITYEKIFSILPFENSVVVLEVTGKWLKTFLRITQSGYKGFFPTSGVVLKVMDSKSNPPSSDLNGNGKIDAWEVNRLVDAQFADGRKIEDSKTYRLATIDFLVSGGDDLGWIMGQVPQKKITVVQNGLMRDIFAAHIRSLGKVNSPAQPILDPEHPRLKFVKGPETKTKKKSRRRKKR